MTTAGTYSWIEVVSFPENDAHLEGHPRLYCISKIVIIHNLVVIGTYQFEVTPLNRFDSHSAFAIATDDIAEILVF